LVFCVDSNCKDIKRYTNVKKTKIILIFLIHNFFSNLNYFKLFHQVKHCTFIYVDFNELIAIKTLTAYDYWRYSKRTTLFAYKTISNSASICLYRIVRNFNCRLVSISRWTIVYKHQYTKVEMDKRQSINQCPTLLCQEAN